MVIIGFANKTSKPVVQLICRHFKHCVIITKQNNKLVLYQFVKRRYVVQITLTKRGIAQLRLNGWVFIYLDAHVHDLNYGKYTCVNFVKHAIGIRNIWIQTPNALYKYLKRNLTK